MDNVKKVLIVVDMQNDFLTGALKNDKGVEIIPKVVDKINDYMKNDDYIILTQDTHASENYLYSEEGKHLPVEHCVYNSEGWQLCDPIKEIFEEYHDKEGNVTRMISVIKSTFGCASLGMTFSDIGLTYRAAEEAVIELVGVCTDICVIANAIVAKTFLPNAHIVVDASCCAGTSEENHKTALEAMKNLQIEITNE